MTDAFEFPDFFEYPPYFTLQPNPDTQRKQVELWKSLILRYCRHHRAFTLHLEDDAHPLFANPRCRRRLPLDARRAMVDALVADGAAEWLDHPTRTRCLVLWRSIGAWADILWEWAAAYGLQGQVASEEDVVGPGGPERFRGAGSELVQRAARALEEAGKAAYIPGEGGDDAGIKFF